MLTKSTRTEFRMLMGLLVLGLALMALTGCGSAAGDGVQRSSQRLEAPVGFSPTMPHLGG